MESFKKDLVVKSTFDSAQKELFHLMAMNNVYSNFLNSTYYPRMTRRMSNFKIPKIEKSIGDNF